MWSHVGVLMRRIARGKQIESRRWRLDRLCARVTADVWRWLCRGVTLSPFYRQRGLDFVCSMPNADGMSKCNDLLPFELNGTHCNASLADDGSWAPPTSSSRNQSCIDWNRYYTSCRVTDTNPFHDAISFDDIGHAWVAIFQVTLSYCFTRAHTAWPVSI